MTSLKYPLFHLPIHHYIQKKYKARHDHYVETQKKRLLEDYGTSFDDLSEERQLDWVHLWWWPEWKFNDIVGFLDIGMDSYNHMTSEIYFRRKYFKRGSSQRMRCRIPSVANQYLFWREVEKTPVWDLTKNEDYLSALKEIIKIAKQLIRNRNKTFKLWLLPFDFSCIDFVKAHKQAIESNSLSKQT